MAAWGATYCEKYFANFNLQKCRWNCILRRTGKGKLRFDIEYDKSYCGELEASTDCETLAFMQLNAHHPPVDMKTGLPLHDDDVDIDMTLVQSC